MRHAWVLVVLAGCPAPPKVDTSPSPPDPIPSLNELRVRAVELESEILASYDRDEAPEISMTMIPPRIDAQKVPHPIGPMRIGVGPGDVLIVDELMQAQGVPSRWPLDVDPAIPTEARSKKLEVHVSRDGTAAWAFDEISWRLKACGRVAVIPLRLTALYAYAGERWVPVFEDLSFAHAPAPLREGHLPAKVIPSEVISRDLADAFSTLLSPVLARRQASVAKTIANGPEAMLLGPDVLDEWHGPDVLIARLVGDATLKLEDRRVGVVGSGEDHATVGYWVGNIDAKLPARPGVAAGTSRLRGAFVFELRRTVTVDPGATRKPDLDDVSCGQDSRNCEWVLVQGHVSEPITDEDLANSVFGTSLLSPKPVELACDERATPAAAPRAPKPTSPPPAARSR